MVFYNNNYNNSNISLAALCQSYLGEPVPER